jgi:hypothetical protein
MLLRTDTLDPWTGRRTPWRELRAAAIAGLRIEPPFITPDGRTYVYAYALNFSDLFVLTGLY